MKLFGARGTGTTMRSRLVVLVASMCAVAACSPDPATDDAGLDAGNLATDAGRDAGVDAGVPVPLKVVFVFDGSQSLTVTDPNGERGAALLDFLSQLPQTDDVSVAVMVFNGTTIAWLSPSGQPVFTGMSAWTPAARQTLQTQLLNFVQPGTGPYDTDFVFALSNAWTLVYQDAMSALTNGTPPKANYSVIFVSDGRPTVDQDDALLCGDAVRRIRNLRLYSNDVFVHAVHLFKPAQTPTCTGDAGVLTTNSSCRVPTPTNPGACPPLEVQLDAERLRRMAMVGSGQFRDFRSGQAVSFVGLTP